MGRYEARLDGGSLGTFDDPEAALEALSTMLHSAFRKGRPALPEIRDIQQDLPFEEQAIWDWFDAWAGGMAAQRPQRAHS
ncbi:hypothetical protein [Siccirubricoccus sp. G192]|uniref:hypothetical protein n=1 Tax=Siccirubricoccus sp. G192 TaxID=2849651 RepID=UPI001C2C9CA7|nr:hypothetical protein [Siccirubricoccus sp. G192]MBV1798579.1 hypothetical protein [Siccirubricoccus sp. G192]